MVGDATHGALCAQHDARAQMRHYRLAAHLLHQRIVAHGEPVHHRPRLMGRVHMPIAEHELVDGWFVEHHIAHEQRAQPRVGRVDRAGGAAIQALQQIVDVFVFDGHAGAQHVI